MAQDSESDPLIGPSTQRPFPMLHRWWWAPIAFAILALALLTIVPILVDYRVTRLRNALTNGSEHARVVLNDLEAAFATRAFTPGFVGSDDTLAVATRAHLADDEAELRRTVPLVSPMAVHRFQALDQQLRVWTQPIPRAFSDAATIARARAVLASAEQLDAYLATVSDSLRTGSQQLEHFDVVMSMVLAPVALVAVLMVLWVGGRLATFARVADTERAEVVRSTEARAALLRGVTHDVKNPLGAAAGFAQLLEEGIVGSLTPAQLEIVGRIRRLVYSSVEILTDLLDLARADAADVRLDLSTVDLSELAKQLIDDHSGVATEHGVKVDLVPQPVTVVTDAPRVRRVLTNLLSNAIKYTPRGGHVTVSVVQERRGNAARAGVAVADTGPGIPPDLRAKVFDEFFRIGRSNAEQPGNGLGLSISRRLARLLGGDIELRDHEGGGSIFTLWLRSATAPARGAADAASGTPS